MKIAVLSDSHDNLPNIKKALDYINKQGINFLIHCGDISSEDTSKIFAKKFNGEIHAVTGNVSASPEDIKKKIAGYNFTLHDETGEVDVDGKKIAFNHYPWEAKKLAESGKYDLIFYGHDHTPFEKMINHTKILNPGNLDGSRHKATFAIYDTNTDKAELILLEKI